MKVCRVVRGGVSYHGKQGLDYQAGISRESVGSDAICMHLLRMPPGQRAKAHLHEGHETAIYVLQGRVRFSHGPNLEHVDECVAGDFVYIPPGVPHLPWNPSDTEESVAVIARTDPNEQESVVPRPELDRIGGASG